MFVGLLSVSLLPFRAGIPLILFRVQVVRLRTAGDTGYRQPDLVGIFGALEFSHGLSSF
jgi:hypothetical protein